MFIALSYLISNFTYMEEYLISGFEDVNNNGGYVGDGVWYKDVEGGYTSGDWDFLPETTDFVSDDNSSLSGNAARISINTGGSAGDDWLQIRVDYSLSDPDGDGKNGWNLAEFDYLALRVKAASLQDGAGYYVYLQVEDADQDRRQCEHLEPSITISDTNGWKIFLYPKSSFTFTIYSNGDGVIDWSQIYFFYIQINDAPDDPTSSPNVILLDRLSAFRSSWWHLDWSNGGGKWYISSPQYITFNGGDSGSDQVQIGMEFTTPQDFSGYGYFSLWAGYMNPTGSGTWRVGLMFEDSDGTRAEAYRWWANDIYLVDTDYILRRYIFPKSSYTNNIFAGADNVLNWASIKKIFVQFDDTDDSSVPSGQVLSVQWLEALTTDRFILKYTPSSVSGGNVSPGQSDVKVASGVLNYNPVPDDLELMYSHGSENATLSIDYAGVINYGSDSDVSQVETLIGATSLAGTFSGSSLWHENISAALAPGGSLSLSAYYDISTSAVGGHGVDGALLVALPVKLNYPQMGYDPATANLTSIFPWWGGGASRPSIYRSAEEHYSNDTLNITYNWGTDAANSGWVMLARDVWRYDLSRLKKIVLYVKSSSSNTGYIGVKLREADATADYELPGWIGNASFSLSFDGWKKFEFDVDDFSMTGYGNDPVAGLQKDRIHYLIIAMDEGGAGADTSGSDHTVVIGDVAFICEYDSPGSYTIESSTSSSGGSGTSTSSTSTEGVPEISSGEVLAYPVPVKFSSGESLKLVAGYNKYLSIKETVFYIFSFNGNFVTKIKVKGSNYAVWDGKDYSGKSVPEGVYFVVSQVIYADSSFVKSKPAKFVVSSR